MQGEGNRCLGIALDKMLEEYVAWIQDVTRPPAIL